MTEISLTDGSNPKIIGWTKKNTQYVLQVEFSNNTDAEFRFIHDLSEQSEGKISLLMPVLMPVKMGGKTFETLQFTMIVLGG